MGVIPIARVEQTRNWMDSGIAVQKMGWDSGIAIHHGYIQLNNRKAMTWQCFVLILAYLHPSLRVILRIHTSVHTHGLHMSKRVS